MTNADVIRQMTDGELYKFLQAFETGDIDYSLTFCSLCKDTDLDCDECFTRWLFNDAHDYNGLLKDKGINSGYAKDEPMKTTDYCDICKRDMCEVCVADIANPYCVPSHYEIKQDEPQSCSVSGRPYSECSDCEYFRCTADEPQFDKDINVRSKDKPQTEVYKCPKCGKDTPIEFDECVWCLSPKDEPLTKCDLCKREGDDICLDCERKKQSGKE